jgi:hypothetical protein
VKIKKVKGWWLIRLALTIVGKKGLAEMTKASKNAQKAQETLLRKLLTAAKDTGGGGTARSIILRKFLRRKALRNCSRFTKNTCR